MHLGKILVVVGAFARVLLGACEYIPIQERAQGRSLSGSIQFNDSVYTNPAGAGFTQIYSVEGSLIQGGLAASIIDTKTSGVGGAVGYFRRDARDNAVGLQALRIGAFGKLTPNIAIGTTGKSLWTDGFRMNDADVGALVRLTPLEFGVTVRNVLGGNPGFEKQSRDLATGMRIGIQEALYFSVAEQSSSDRPFAPTEIGFGAEFVSPYFFSLKGGYRIETESGKRNWTAGVSLLSPRILAHYAIEFPGAPDEASLHQVAVSILF